MSVNDMQQERIVELKHQNEKLKRALDGLTSSVLVYLRDLRHAASDLSCNVYLDKNELELLNMTIAALEKSLANG